MRDTTLTLGGDEWQIKFVTKQHMPWKKTWGLCDRDKKIIFVRRDLSTKNVLDTLLHEMRHAQHPIMFEAESFINSTSTELADGLLKTGLVRTEQTP